MTGSLDDFLGPSWQDRARCGRDPEAFFDPKRVDEALALCAACPVREPCDAYARANDEQAGIWGGVWRGPESRRRPRRRYLAG